MTARPSEPVPSRRIIVISVALAVLAHVGILVAFARAKGGRAPHPPDVSGFADDRDAASGLPAASERLVTFRIVDADSEDAPVPRAIVRDVLGDQWTTTNDTGVARLRIRPAAQLLVRVERPGFAIVGERAPNAGYDDHGHTIHLHRAPVPYAIVDTIFIQRCVYCHGAQGRVAGINLTSYARVIESTSNGAPIVTPGRPEASPLVRVLRDSIGEDGKRRPHSRITSRVPRDDVEWIAQWVREGANGPSRPR